MKKYEIGKSYVQRMLDADPELRARADELRRVIREPDEDFIAMRESTRLTAADYAIVINARADDYSFR